MEPLDDFVLLTSQAGPVPSSAPVLAEAAYGAAELVGLLRLGRIALGGSKVRVIDPTPTGSPFLDDGLARLRQLAPTRCLSVLRRLGRLGLQRARRLPPAAGPGRRTAMWWRGQGRRRSGGVLRSAPRFVLGAAVRKALPVVGDSLG